MCVCVCVCVSPSLDLVASDDDDNDDDDDDDDDDVCVRTGSHPNLQLSLSCLCCRIGGGAPPLSDPAFASTWPVFSFSVGWFRLVADRIGSDQIKLDLSSFALLF